MKIQYLGSAAAERVPAIFCDCRVCNYARAHGGKDLRTQMQTLVDDGKLLIDFPGDSYLHMREHQLNFNNIEHLLITHWHSDHLYAEDLAYRMRGYANNLDRKLTIYGNAWVREFVKRAFLLEESYEPERIDFQTITAFQPVQIGDYLVHPLPAEHGHRQGDCYIYTIEDGTKRFFYTHDTGYPSEAVLDYLENNHLYLDLISFDCTGQGLQEKGGIHMNLGENLRLLEELKRRGVADEKTKLVVSHFSHNGGLTHEEMSQLATPYHMVTAYDGLDITF